MPVTRLEFALVRSLDDFYDQLAAQIVLPAHFGHNLDALFDVLTAEIAGPLEIVWHEHNHSATLIGHDNYTALLATLQDAADERSDLELKLD